MDPNDEASKLLEKALSSFDGIILGKITVLSRPDIKLLIFYYSYMRKDSMKCDGNSDERSKTFFSL